MTWMHRQDLQLTQHTTLVLLYEAEEFYVRLLDLRQRRPTFLTPQLRIEQQRLEMLTDGAAYTVELERFTLHAEGTSISAIAEGRELVWGSRSMFRTGYQVLERIWKDDLRK